MGVSGLSHAAIINVNSNTFNLSATQVDTNLTATATSSSNVTPTGTAPALARFNASTGVLTGATLSVNSTRTETVGGSATKAMGSARTANFVGSSTASFAATGITGQSFASISASTSCALAMGMSGSCTPTAGSSGAQATNASSLAVSAGNLNSYAGAGNVSGLGLTLPTISANISGSNTLNGGSATTALNWTGTVSASYNYLLHADASFNGSSDQNSLTLDFGSVLQGSSVSPLTFSIFNLANLDRVGLDLDSFSGTGDIAQLGTNLAPFSALSQGGSSIFNAFLDTSTEGLFNAQYVLNLSDANVGASSTWQNQQLTLNLVGNVTAVPVPAAVWLFGSAVMGWVGMGRRKQLA